MLQELETAARKLLKKYDGEYTWVQEIDIHYPPCGTFIAARTQTNGRRCLAKVANDGTVIAVALEKCYTKFQSPGINGNPASWFRIVEFPNQNQFGRRIGLPNVWYVQKK